MPVKRFCHVRCSKCGRKAGHNARTCGRSYTSKSAKKQRQYRRKSENKRRAKRRAEGRCYICGLSTNGFTRCLPCRIEGARHARNYRARMKERR